FSDVIDPWPPAWLGEDDARQGIVAAGNDLEAPALDHAPAIAEVLGCLSSLDGAWLSRMSGSGATCFALMDNDVSAEKARAHIQEALPSAWVALGRVEV
ncbi:MAG: 4-(cytidine 5'-diphospho)-2-C-methyl-D-erythritol kinase, partial [Sphingomonadales bacterium]|nr:4-(cytidine 5'-diphospho)-2-C-methyl-D-erythritol kinase [Sphingomonadales bacterium]